MSYSFNSQWDTFLVSLTNVSTLSLNVDERGDERIGFLLAILTMERCEAMQHSLLPSLLSLRQNNGCSLSIKHGHCLSGAETAATARASQFNTSH